MSASVAIAAFRASGTGPATLLTQLRARTRGVQAALRAARLIRAIGTELPPEIFGYVASYKNPFRPYDIDRARQLLAEAGYRNGIDPATNTRLKLSFDTSATAAAANLQFEYLANAWRQLGLDVEINGTTYNQFQDKVRRGAYQIFIWGWIADFPDPENFLFLLECQNARSKSGGPNTANFCNAEYDRLYKEMKDLPNTEHRAGLIGRMLAILVQERPWIELYHEEDFMLNHAWLVNAKPMGISYPAYKYKDVRPEVRARLRAEWNASERWPLVGRFSTTRPFRLPMC